MHPSRYFNILNWPPGVWGLLYFLAIPAYAAIFHFVLPEKSFYHATLRYEPETQERARRILTKIWEDYQHPGPDQYGPCAKFEPFAQKAVPDSLRIDGDDVSFSIVFLAGDFKRHPCHITTSCSFSLSQDVTAPHMPPGKGRGRKYKQLTLDNLAAYPLLVDPKDRLQLAECLFPRPFLYTEKVPKDMIMFTVSIPLHEELEGLADSMRGIPARDEDGLWRMIYLSASTITTSGFGDIVPLTRRARIAVMTESILGAFLIGMFLNAVGRRR